MSQRQSRRQRHCLRDEWPWKHKRKAVPYPQAQRPPRWPWRLANIHTKQQSAPSLAAGEDGRREKMRPEAEQSREKRGEGRIRPERLQQVGGVARGLVMPPCARLAGMATRASPSMTADATAASPPRTLPPGDRKVRQWFRRRKALFWACLSLRFYLVRPPPAHPIRIAPAAAAARWPRP